jgi:signal transduction histidine kinase
MTLASDQNLDLSKLSFTSRRMFELRQTVLAEWEKRVRAAFKEAKELRHPVFINTIPSFYDNIVEAVTPDYSRTTAAEGNTLASAHGSERARLTNYDPEALILEYQIFRVAIFDVLGKDGVDLTGTERTVIHTSIDDAMREAVSAFSLMSALREQFVASLTHDLRTPLGTAAMSAELITHITDSDKVIEHATRIKRNLARMDDMISTLLDTMVFQSGRRLHLDLSNFDILEVVQEVSQQLHTTGDKRCEVIGESVQVCWDRKAIRRALENLVGNAIKYGSPDAPIRIKIDEAEERLMLSVHNEGDPIPVAEQESIFQIFQRAYSAKQSKKQGWGVGLPYVRAVAESHGGSIVVDSTVDRGTTFLLDIPVDSTPFLSAPTVGYQN